MDVANIGVPTAVALAIQLVLVEERHRELGGRSH